MSNFDIHPHWSKIRDMRDFTSLFPPRTKMKLPPGSSDARTLWDSLPDAIGQFKMDGTRNLTVIHPDGRRELYGRGSGTTPGTLQKQFIVTPAMNREIDKLELPKGELHVLDGEFVHAKTATIKDVLYQFDILVYRSKYLLGVTGQDRYLLLKSLMERRGSDRYFPLDFKPIEGRMYLAENFARDKWDWMWQIVQPVSFCEGIVLKRMGAISALEFGGQEYNNSYWMTRIRKPKKNYIH